MYSLLVKIRQFLETRQETSLINLENLDKLLPVRGAHARSTNIDKNHANQLPSFGRRANRDRKIKLTHFNQATLPKYPVQEGDQEGDRKGNQMAAELTALEQEIRATVEKLPQALKTSYLTLLEALLRRSQAGTQIELIRALHLTVLDALRNEGV